MKCGHDDRGVERIGEKPVDGDDLNALNAGSILVFIVIGYSQNGYAIFFKGIDIARGLKAWAEQYDQSNLG